MATPIAAYNFDEDSGIALDLSGNGHDFSLGGASVIRVPGHTESGIRSTGAVSATLPDVGRTPERTIMGWLSFSGIPTSWPAQMRAATIDSGAWGILYLAPNIVIQGRSNTELARASAPWPADGQPHHVAGTYDGSALRLYIDAVLAATTPLAGPLRVDTEPLALWSGTGSMSAGYLDDLRLFDVACSGAEITELRDTPVLPLVDPGPDPEPSRPQPEIQTGGWAFLQETLRWNAQEYERERAEPPLACPIDGEPLVANSEGVLDCPFGNYRRVA